MAQYKDPLKVDGLLPTNSTFSSISFVGSIYLLWVNQVIQESNQYTVTTDINLLPQDGTGKVYLPTTKQQAIGAKFMLNNVTGRHISVYSVDGEFMVTLDPYSGATPNAVYFQIIAQTDVQVDNWQMLVAGSNSNTFNVSDVLGNGLQANVLSTGANVILKKYNTGLLQDILSRNPLDVLQFVITDDSSALDSLGYTLMITDTLNRQAVILLDNSVSMAMNWGYGVSFINASTRPMVIYTKANDTINGFQNEASTGGSYASFVIDIGETCELIATRYNGWHAAITNSTYKKTIDSVNINVSSAKITKLNNDYYIDFSKAYDVAYSELLILTGSLDQAQYPIGPSNGLYLVMPNNISTLYTIRSLLTGYTNFKIGLGVMTADGVFLKTTGLQMTGNTLGGVAYTYICYNSNNVQVTDILPLRDPAL